MLSGQMSSFFPERCDFQYWFSYTRWCGFVSAFHDISILNRHSSGNIYTWEDKHILYMYIQQKLMGVNASSQSHAKGINIVYITNSFMLMLLYQTFYTWKRHPWLYPMETLVENVHDVHVLILPLIIIKSWMRKLNMHILLPTTQELWLHVKTISVTKAMATPYWNIGSMCLRCLSPFFS